MNKLSCYRCANTFITICQPITRRSYCWQWIC